MSLGSRPSPQPLPSFWNEPATNAPSGIPSRRRAAARVSGVCGENMPNRIAIEGHTDNVPIRTAQFPSNWELSQARASSVLQRMITDGLEPTRLNLSAYGEYKPIDTNSTEVGKARNRRVAIVVLASQTSPQTPIASPSPVATSAP